MVSHKWKAQINRTPVFSTMTRRSKREQSWKRHRAQVEQSSTVLIHSETYCPHEYIDTAVFNSEFCQHPRTHMGTIRLPNPKRDGMYRQSKTTRTTGAARHPQENSHRETLSVHDSFHPKHPAGQGAVNGKQSAKCSSNFIFLRSGATNQRHWSFPFLHRTQHRPSPSCSQPRRTSRKARYVNDSNSSGHPSASISSRRRNQSLRCGYADNLRLKSRARLATNNTTSLWATSKMQRALASRHGMPVTARAPYTYGRKARTISFPTQTKQLNTINGDRPTKLESSTTHMMWATSPKFPK